MPGQRFYPLLGKGQKLLFSLHKVFVFFLRPIQVLRDCTGQSRQSNASNLQRRVQELLSLHVTGGSLGQADVNIFVADLYWQTRTETPEAVHNVD